MTPTNKEEWWQLLESRWESILNICYWFLPMWDKIDIEGNPTQQQVRETIMTLKQNRDPNICRYLNAAWAVAPDDSSTHSIPGWGVLCDLCSEEWCLYD